MVNNAIQQNTQLCVQNAKLMNANRKYRRGFPWPQTKKTKIFNMTHPDKYCSIAEELDYFLDTLQSNFQSHADLFPHGDPDQAKYAVSLLSATHPGNPPGVLVWSAKTGQFGSRTVQKPDQQTLGGLNPDQYSSARASRRVCLDLSVPISSSRFRVWHLVLHSDMRLSIIKHWPWYVTLRFWRISRLDVQNKNNQELN